MDNAHLSEENVAQAAEALNSDAYMSLESDIKQHLSFCDDCNAEVLMVSSLLDAEEGDKALVADAGTSVRRRLRKRLLSMGAVACVLLLVGISFVYLSTDDQPELMDNKLSQSTMNEGDSNASVSDDQDLLAFVPNRRLEKMVSRFDGSTTRNCGNKIVSKSMISANVGSVVLHWESSRNEELTIEIFDNKENTLLTNKTSQNFLKSSIDTPGLYYWKLYNQDFDLLFCGKIHVSN